MARLPILPGLALALAGCHRATVSEVAAEQRPFAGADAVSRTSQRAADASPAVPAAASKGAPMAQAPLPH